MKKNALTFIGLSFIAVASLTSCSKDEDDTTPPVLTAKQASNFTADPAVNGGHYAFFSLETNEVIPYTDSATSKWDIAIRSTTILTNGGTSGPGAGGAFVQRAASFDSYATIPADSTFRTDNVTAPSYAIPTGSGNGWYNYDFTTNVIAPIPGNILVVRTASGKYAKIEILSYYKDAPPSVTPTALARYYSFRFIYQPNGTKTF